VDSFDIIILSYNSRDRIKRCIESVRKFTKEDYLITVVDNDSKDGSRQYLSSLKDIQTIFSAENLGCSKATNLAFKKTKREFIVLLDDDAEVSRGWLTKISTQMRNITNVGIVGCKIRFPDNRIMSAEYMPRLLKAVGYGEMDRGQRNYTRECDVVMRTCLLLKRELIGMVGYFDERFTPGQYETIDYCLRVRQAGYKILYTGSVSIMHHHLFRGKNVFQEMEKVFLKKWKNKLLESPLKDSHPVDAYITNGISFLGKKEYKKAIVELKKAEALDRRFSDPFYMGTALYHIKEYKAAIKEFKKALYLNPRDIIPHYYLALLYEKTGNMRKMRKEANSVLEYFSAHKNTSFTKRIDNMEELGKSVVIDGSLHTITYYE